MIRTIKKLIILYPTIFLCSCSGVNFSDWHFPYMMEVEQGTYITDNQFKQLKIGMSKDQVIFVLGHPLSQYLFDKNRWDFPYQEYKNNNLKKSYNVTILFDNKSNVVKFSKSGDSLFKN